MSQMARVTATLPAVRSSTGAAGVSVGMLDILGRVPDAVLAGPGSW
jgi:hypothetical protein